MHAVTTIGEAWQWLLNILEEHYPIKERKALAQEVFLHFFGLNPAERILCSHQPVMPGWDHILKNVVEQLSRQVPIEYITGVAYFLDNRLNVDYRVLIPRPETEELVLWVLDFLRERDQDLESCFSVLDVGTGSGCIPIALAKKMPYAQISACDTSTEALELAAHNARRNKADIHFFYCDIIKDDPSIQDLDVVVSNPPYVMEKEKLEMKANVLDYEPGAALFVSDEDPLLFYRNIASRAFHWLKPGGLIFFEINENLGKETAECLGKAGFKDIILKKDLNGKNRMLKGIKP